VAPEPNWLIYIRLPITCRSFGIKPVDISSGRCYVLAPERLKGAVEQEMPAMQAGYPMTTTIKLFLE
jgi:hypothetical protein